MDFQLLLFEMGRLMDVRSFLEKIKRSHRKSSNFELVLDNMIRTIGEYKSSVDKFGLGHSDFALERVSCFVEIMIQSLISASMYSYVGCEFLNRRYGDEAFDLIPNHTRDDLLKFWQKETPRTLKPRLKFAIDGGWDGDRAFIRLLRL